MGDPVNVDILFVELSADEADDARVQVEKSLTASGASGFTVVDILPDPDLSHVFGVEVSAPPGTAPAAGWDIAHALAEKLGAKAEAVLGAELDSFTAQSAFGAGESAPEVLVMREPAWHLDTIHAEAAWALSKGAGVLIGHPDTGTTKHPELGEGRVLIDEGKSFLGEAKPIDPLDDMGFPGHGTATASLMISPRGAETGKNSPVSGLAPEAKVLPLRVSNSVVILGWQRRLALAIEYALEKGCKVLSMSLGGLGGARLHRAIRAARKSGAIVVAAAGNYVQFVVWPALHDEVIACAATTPDHVPWWGSSKGPAVDIAAPGAEVVVARWKNWKATAGPGDGTSFATALVASAAALWLSFHGDKINALYQGAEVHDAFRTLLRKTAAPLASTRPFPANYFGAGLLDCGALLAAELPKPEEIERTSSAETLVAPAPARRELSEMLQTLLLASRLPTAQEDAEAFDEAAISGETAVVTKRVEDFLEALLPPSKAGEEGLMRQTPGLLAELSQVLVLDRQFREDLLASLGFEPAGASLPAAPEGASSALRALFEAHTTPSAEPPNEPAKQPDALRLRFQVDVEVRIGDVRVDARS